jgi:hypothetical protein
MQQSIPTLMLAAPRVAGGEAHFDLVNSLQDDAHVWLSIHLWQILPVAVGRPWRPTRSQWLSGPSGSCREGVALAAARRSISEKGGCSESTCRTASHRSSNDTSKLLTPPQRTLPALISRTISFQQSSTGVPVSSGQ